MTSADDICSLDYLIGTLSTAYKGVITSLAVKNFCMTAAGSSVVLKGTVISIPEGNYEASLIRKGIELARTALSRGYFELSAEADRIKQAPDLQIDIIQSGRHIGTFLLKKESGGGFYQSAIELSGELRNMDLRLLTAPLREKIGLLRKAEEIVTALLSSKKDWNRLSGSLRGFAGDFFWSARGDFYGAFPILAHFLRRAAEKTDPAETGKPLSNFLDLMELPLEHEQNADSLRPACEAWLKELDSSSADLSVFLHRSVLILRSVHRRSPGANVGPALAGLIHSVRQKLFSLPALPPSLYDRIRGRVGPDAFERLSRYGSAARLELLRKLAAAEQELEEGSYEPVSDLLAGLDPDLLNDAVMTRTFSEEIVARARSDSAAPLAEALIRLFSLFPVLSRRALETVRSDIPVFIEKLVSLNRNDLCGSILDEIDRTGPIRDDMVLDSRIAESVLRSQDENLLRRYVRILTGIVIPSPRVRGISADTWAEVVNPLHLERLARFMDLVQLGGDRFEELLVHATANLFVTGVFIPDDRLFQRRVSAYLNSPAMRAPFLLNLLFLGRLPVYYNEIGAVSRIRDSSTEIDSWGNDPVLYFIRKQVHVNASNHNVRLVEKVIMSWVDNDPALLRDVVPQDVYANLKPDLFARYSAAIRPLFERLDVLDPGGLRFERLLRAPDSEFAVSPGDGEVDEIRAKVMLLCRLYRELVKKYSLGKTASGSRPLPGLPESLAEMTALAGTIRHPEATTAAESLYFKRHIAFGIPSVLGTYHEPKFDAVAGFLRIDARIRLQLENAIAGIRRRGADFPLSDLRSGLDAAAAACRILELHGLANPQIEEFIAVIGHNDLYLSQLADVLRMWQKELAWMVRSVSGKFHESLARILAAIPNEDLPANLLNLDPAGPDYADKATDILIRDILAEVPGLTEADRLIEGLLGALTKHSERFGDEKLDHGRSVPKGGLFVIQEMTDQDAARTGPRIGAKAKNLVYLGNRGFPVPAGVVLAAGLSDREREALLRDAVAEIERRTGTVFGDPQNPLFLSVRSGSYVSMPGILSTILYCGMNDMIAEGFSKAAGDPALAFDSYRRFIEQYATTVLGVDPVVLERIRTRFGNSGGASGFELPRADERLAVRYREELERRGLSIPTDVYEQLNRSVRAVAASWDSERAVQFRTATKTSERWGTSVILMQMVYGNARGSGASVLFTRDPFTAEARVYGETRENATGDDLVRGGYRNRVLSRRQVPSPTTGTADGRASLEEADPALFAQHRELALSIERAMGLPQEAEVTYVRQPDGSRRIFVLQTRRMELDVDPGMQFEEVCAMGSRIIGRGMGAHGGAVSGVASFAKTPGEIARLQKETSLPVILIRTTANTDDVSLMPFIRGIVTASGGVTSHAAVLAQRFRINAVVACSGMRVTVDRSGEASARSGGTVIREGSEISIDGSTGLVFSGLCREIKTAVRRAGRR